VIEEKYIITKSELENLIKGSWNLNALESMGVDNWCGYGEAFEEYDVDKEVDFSEYQKFEGE